MQDTWDFRAGPANAGYFAPPVAPVAAGRGAVDPAVADVGATDGARPPALAGDLDGAPAAVPVWPLSWAIRAWIAV